MTLQTNPKAIIADDEAPLRDYLKRMLAEAWPELTICAEAGNGEEAVAAVQAHHPHVAFLDIRMPGLSGIQAAETIAKTSHIVFVTAYDEYAVAAFEKEAIDYLLKPVSRERLSQTVERLKNKLGRENLPETSAVEWMRKMIDLAASAAKPDYLNWLRVQHGDGVQLIAVADVVYFQARDKYTAVITQAGESLIRKSIRELSEELDPDGFWQIHRGTIVNLAQIDKVSRSLTGRGVIRLKGRPESLTVSRSFLGQFKQM